MEEETVHVLFERPLEVNADEKPYIIIPADRSYIQILDYKIEDYGDLESFVEDLRKWKNDESKEFYNKQINELYRIIDNYEGIVRDYATLVSSMQDEICKYQKEIVEHLEKIKELESLIK